MSSQFGKLDDAVAALTADGQPFQLETVSVGGVDYQSYATMPGTLRLYFELMNRHAGKDFAVYREERYTFDQAYAISTALAAALVEGYGISPGDRVAILSRNNPQWMMAFIAVVSVGAVAVPMNGWWTTEELDYGFGDCGARLVVADRDRAERLVPIAGKYQLQVIGVDDCSALDLQVTPFRELTDRFTGAEMPPVEVAPDDHATIMYTSGSTGHPKGALSSHRGILSALYSWMLLGLSVKAVSASEQESSEPGYPPTGLLTIPLFHCTGSHSAFMLSVVIGRKLVIMHKWDPHEALRLIEQERVTWFNGVPTMSAELQAAAETSERDISSLAEIMAGGAARPPDQVDKIRGTFRKSSAGIGYGLTETNALGAVNSGTAYEARPGSTGRVVPAVTEICILDEQGRELPPGERGEVCIKSPANVLGYWNKPEATAEAFIDGWFHSGDVGYLDEDGFLYIVDRIKDIIIRGGENISCLEVEAAVYTHPAVHEVAVFGLPDQRLGEIVGAAVVLRDGVELTTEELTAYLADHLAAFKIPAHIWFRGEQLPRIASGKIFKRQLKSDYSAQLEQQLQDV